MKTWLVFRRKRRTRRVSIFKRKSVYEYNGALGLIDSKNFKNALYQARQKYKEYGYKPSEIFVKRWI